MAELVRAGAEAHEIAPRGAFSGLKVRFTGPRLCALEVAIDALEGSTRRLVCHTDGNQVWTVAAAGDEFLSDFAVHPSGEITLALERTSRDHDGYELVRLGVSGNVLSRQVLAVTAIPPEDRPDLPDPPFLFRSRPPHALAAGWLRVEARGEDLVSAWLSRIQAPGGGYSNDLALGVGALSWTGETFAERWSRVVEGRHGTEPAAWTYDEFRWREAAVQPLLAVAEDGTAIVGRSWNVSRCLAVSRTFGEFTEVQCRGGFPGGAESEYLPIAFTSFTADGVREGTHSYVPDRAAEFVAFDLAVRGDALALVGAAVFPDPTGNVVRYPPEPGADPVMVPYDGYAAVLDRRSGALRCQKAVDAFGRGDYLAAVRWAADGTLLAAGAAGWDRWYGGMSISRGADPWLVALSPSCEPLASRVVNFSSPQRHHYLLGLDAQPGRIAAAGFSDAPMTHSGDGGNIDQRMFGGLRIDLR